MASFYVLPSGRVRAQIALRGVRRSQTFVTKTAAKAWAAREEAAILDGTGDKWPSKTLGDALKRYLREVTPTKGSPKFESVVIGMMLRDFSALCGRQLSRLTTQDLADWRDERLRTVSGSTVIRQGKLLRNVWSVAAREWKWCPRESPWTDLRWPEHNRPRERINDWREIRVMLRQLNYFTGRAPTSMVEEVAYAWLISLRTAMRASEVLSITPETVRGQVVTLHKHKTIKSTGRARHVPITRQAARLIALCKRFTVSSASLAALFRKARVHAGLSGFTYHDSRATAITLLSRRVDVLTLQRITGHKNIGQLQVYYRESPEDIAARL